MLRSTKEPLNAAVKYIVKIVPVFARYVFTYVIYIVLIATLFAAGYSNRYDTEVDVIIYSLVVLLVLSFLCQAIDYIISVNDRIYRKIKFLPERYQRRFSVLLISCLQLILFTGLGMIFLFVYDNILLVIGVS